MKMLMNFPVLVFIVSTSVLSLATYLGRRIGAKKAPDEDSSRQEFDIVMGATLTLLGLIIGFTFSMAVSRYDQRKNDEEEEANAIGTEYLRVDFLPAAQAAETRRILEEYLQLRIAFYTSRSAGDVQKINDETNQLEQRLWSSVQVPAAAQPLPTMVPAVTGMNDVINTQGYTQAAWWNRIPVSAWNLMMMIAICSNILVGYRLRHATPMLLITLPVIVSLSFLLIADIDSPRGGIIRLQPQNLVSLSQSLGHPGQ